MSRPSTKGFFVRERLIEARDGRGMTQRQLAAKLEISDRAISHWERGERAPEPGTLEGLADALDVSPSYFLKPIGNYGSCPIFFRSLSNATLRLRTQEKIKLRWLQDISANLQEMLEFPSIDIPDLKISASYRDISEADLEVIATDLRDHWKLGRGPITSMLLLLENAGVVLGIGGNGSSKIDGQCTWSSSDQRPYVLLARDKDNAFRRQMDAAHELAHLILHKHVSEEQLEADFDIIENQAKYLACAFLLPSVSFAAEISSLSLDGFLSMKKRWMTSVGAMIMRAHHLDILTEGAAKALWKYRATRGWNRREPYDLSTETEVEQPRLLCRSIEMVIDAKLYRKQDLLQHEFCLSASDVEGICALPDGYFQKRSADVVAFEPRLRQSAISPSTATVVPFKKTS